MGMAPLLKLESEGAFAVSATNRWPMTTLHLSNLFEVRRKVAAWIRAPERSLCKKLQTTPNPKA
jgi:hypothetical protein